MTREELIRENEKLKEEIAGLKTKSRHRGLTI